MYYIFLHKTKKKKNNNITKHISRLNQLIILRTDTIILLVNLNNTVVNTILIILNVPNVNLL